ncbi:undecaprenyl-phosphate glucose phosphotransferase [Vibrio sp. SM6]|uniref:Undecaprenyl-phosphate glucose phosphotransferase n=1 Tax=Vibrio agarilyticus TaxID=2726741 RepID=A0A7X8YFN5_9VIBR|nr:undecaprenyl-phosphate glucose phosphotransferase [Vibrio agarilyticus]NLS11740.1 undecaprenyl-phosphate glucose phosphotransferase [Vibrio agarilyticus]
MDKKSFIRSHESEFAFLYRLFDLAIILGLMIVFATNSTTQLTKDHLLVAFIAGLLFLLFSESAQLYRSWRTNTIQKQLLIAASAWLATCLILASGLYFLQEFHQYTTLFWWMIVTPLALISWRLGFRRILSRMRQRGFNTRKAIIIGQTAHGLTLAQELAHHGEHGVIFDGFYDERLRDRLANEPNYPLEGSIEQALIRAKNGEVDYVYIALPMHAKERIAKFLRDFSDTTANTYLLPDFFTYNLLHSRWDQIGAVQTLSVYDTPFEGVSSVIKRLEDIVLSSLILLLISPLLLLIAAAVKLTSKGPVIFKQHRYGLDGRKIDVWKFRSMVTQEQGDDVKQATRNDPRVTPLGAFLRRTSLDELPQFFNVLQGTMSIVGPRPHAVAHNEQYRHIVERYMLRHKVKPGITGWAQVNNLRGETDTLDKMEQRVKFDLDYIHHWSIWMDLKIIFMTIFKGFTGSNAY